MIFHIWKGEHLVAQVELIDDETLVIEDDNHLDVVGLMADGEVVVWDENGEVIHP